ncbi:hypothetical protein B0T14DRAFT_564139 [Immersiella caudata]|uniref:Nephrocystin 3-like N-terminal domain-containing protein n=1 Tax=Immersiella caudata TaxID=314043 RepID=A0AA39WW71_9PEZI|nr:hypothetical protein B0T14DRAFT_564139 [Immersiella caudata]
MDPMSALAIVAIVVQFVDLGGRIIAKGREKQKHNRDRVALLSEHSQTLSSLTTALYDAEIAYDSIYWVTGKPGAGKSTIMKHILQSPSLKVHLANWAGQRLFLVTLYYAWNAGETPQKLLRGLKQSLLYQVLDQYPDFIPMVCPRRWAAFWLFGITPRALEEDMHEWELEECFDNLMEISRTRIALAVFIDGLDEFDVPPHDVAALVESLATTSQNGVKICVASRPWVEFNDAYSDAPKLQMDLRTGSDMEIFVAERFQKCLALRELSAALPEESINLQQDLKQKANSVFIWLKLVVDALELAATEGSGIVELKEIIESLPTDICSLYDTIWDRTPERNRQRGAVLFKLSNQQISPSAGRLCGC